MTEEEQYRRIDEICGKPPMFHLKKRGLFYRPHAAGYTACMCEAGLWTEEEAKKHVYPYDEPVTMHPAPPTNYGSLDAMHEAEKFLRGRLKGVFAEYLCDTLGLDDDYYVPRPEHGDRTYHGNSRVIFDIVSATAAQHRMAFLKTFNRWEDEA